MKAIIKNGVGGYIAAYDCDADGMRAYNSVGWGNVRVRQPVSPQALEINNIIDIHNNDGYVATIIVRRVTIGMDYLEFGGYDINWILKLRIVNEYAGTTGASKSGPADDVMKSIVREQYLATTKRPIADYLDVADDTSEAASIDISFAWRNVYDVLVDITDMARANGDYILFGINRYGQRYRFTTSLIDYDHGVITVSPSSAVIDRDKTNIVIDATDEYTRIVAAGNGEGTDRVWSDYADYSRADNAQIQVIEKFYNAAGRADTVEELDRIASGEFHRRKRITRVNLAVNNVEMFKYGRDWQIGNKIKTHITGTPIVGAIVGIRYSPSGITPIIESRGN